MVNLLGMHIIPPLTINAGTHFTYQQKDGGLSQPHSRVELGVGIEPGTCHMMVHCSTNLLGRNKDNTAEGFADYFLGKIEKIGENFKGKDPYKPCQLEIPQLTKFATVTEQELGKQIATMLAKSCQLDVIPTNSNKY